jgi:hypothetical protein
MSYEQLDSLRNIFLAVEEQRERLRSRSLVWRLRRATVALLNAHAQRRHEPSRASKAESNAERGDRVRALCSLLIRSDNPEVMEALSTQLRQAVDEYVRSARQAHVLNLPSRETEIEPTPSLKPAA